LQAAVERAPASTLALAALANAYHLQRRLDEAATEYAKLLTLEPSTEPSPQEEEAIFRFAPRVFQSASDPFGLKDIVAVHHPTDPVIAYHFFWDDDIDFPDDNDPCDHEVIWVRYDTATHKVSDFHTYFHGRLLRSTEALEDAHRHEERVRVDVQWGKHGSLPYGWERLSIEQENRATYLTLHNEGRRMIDHPLAHSWPRRFDGSWEDFVTFDREVDVVSMLRERRMMSRSRWN